MMLYPNQDAQGREMYDYYKGNKDVLEIIERDDGFIDSYAGAPAYFARFKDWAPHQKNAIRYATGRVLDIGCGAGRHSLHLQGKGHEVVGIDISPFALKVARLRGLKDARPLSIAQVGPSLGRFDTILMMGNNFGLFRNYSQARALLRKFLTITNPGARIIAETLDVYKRPVPVYHRRYHLTNRKRGRMAGEVRIRVRYHEYATPWFDYLLVSKDEMKNILTGTGWAVRKFLVSKGPQYVAVIQRD